MLQIPLTTRGTAQEVRSRSRPDIAVAELSKGSAPERNS